MKVVIQVMDYITEEYYLVPACFREPTSSQVINTSDTDGPQCVMDIIICAQECTDLRH